MQRKRVRSRLPKTRTHYLTRTMFMRKIIIKLQREQPIVKSSPPQGFLASSKAPPRPKLTHGSHTGDSERAHPGRVRLGAREFAPFLPVSSG